MLEAVAIFFTRFRINLRCFVSLRRRISEGGGTKAAAIGGNLPPNGKSLALEASQSAFKIVFSRQMTVQRHDVSGCL